MTVTADETSSSRKEEEWRKSREMQEEVEKNKRIGEAQREFSKVLNQNIGDVKGKGDKGKPPHYIQKFSKPDGSIITESVIVEDMPWFAVAKTTDKVNEVNITLEESIQVGNTEYKPFDLQAYLNKPYVFKSHKEFDDIIEAAKSETLDSLYKKVKGIWSKYIDADDFHISICAADTIFTYYQDKIGLTHYLFFVGNNNVGKSNNLFVLKHLAYRNFTATDMTASNIFTFLGSGEEGQGTLCEDEADRIDDDRQKMGIYKNGYIAGIQVPRTDVSAGRKQEKYNTYCFKAFSAEKFPDPFKAKGFNQRVLEIQCYYGDPDEDISEVQTPGGDERLSQLLTELERLRNLLLAYRLLHFNEKVPDVKLNIKGREKQLFKPIIRVFQNTEILSQLLPVITNYVKQKREANDATFNAFLYTTAVNMIAELQTTTIPSTDFWKRIVSDPEGTEVPGRNLSVETAEFGTISQKEVTQTLEHVFGAKSKKVGGIKKIFFNLPKLQQLGKVYNLSIQVEIIKDKDSFASGDRKQDDWDDQDDIGTGKQEKLPSEAKIHEGNEREKSSKIDENTPKDNLHLSPNGPDRPTYLSSNASQASHASLTEEESSSDDIFSFSNEDGTPLTTLSEEEKAELRAKYDAARSRVWKGKGKGRG